MGHSLSESLSLIASPLLHSSSPLLFGIHCGPTPTDCYSQRASVRNLPTCLSLRWHFMCLDLPSSWPEESMEQQEATYRIFRPSPDLCPTYPDVRAQALVPVLELIVLFGEAFQPLPSGILFLGSCPSFSLGLCIGPL